MTNKEVRWERMFHDQLEAAFDSKPLLYIPYGLCEPHGPQNALGLDALKAHAICCRAAQAGGGIVAPADYWHIHELGFYAAWARREIGEVPRKWLTAVPPWVHFKNVCYHIRAADQIGFKAVILLTGHYGPNWEDLKTVISLIQPFIRARLYGLPDFEANYLGFDKDGQSGADHAGRVETSLLWALEPAGVDISRIPPAPLPPPEPVGHLFAMGRDAIQASRLEGERMVADEISFLLNKSSELLAEYDRERKPEKRIESFEDVEQFWVEFISPILHDFKSMSGYNNYDMDVDNIPSSSVWYYNSANRTKL